MKFSARAVARPRYGKGTGERPPLNGNAFRPPRLNGPG